MTQSLHSPAYVPDGDRDVIPDSSGFALSERLERRNRHAFLEEEAAGLRLAVRVRTAVVAVIIAWLALNSSATGWAYTYSLASVAIFIPLGGVLWLAARHMPHLWWPPYVLIVVDCAVLGYEFTVVNPYLGDVFPPTMGMHLSTFVWFFILLMQSTFSLSWTLVAWCGISIALTRVAQTLYIMAQPGVFTELDAGPISPDRFAGLIFDPNFLSLSVRSDEIIAVLCLSAGLAVTVYRSRRIVARRAEAERQRSSLARYFSPNLIDELVTAEDSIGDRKLDKVSVLFADIVGFTRLCQTLEYREVLAILRSYHARLGAEVFAHGGTLDKYVGDGLMATFGTPRPGQAPAGAALACALDMVDVLDRWNAKRLARRAAPIRVGLGVHFGPAVVGDIGNERRLEFAVIGDTVNVASRVESLTRVLNARLLVTDTVIEAVRRESGPAAGSLGRFELVGPSDLPGRAGDVVLWRLKDRGTLLPD